MGVKIKDKKFLNCYLYIYNLTSNKNEITAENSTPLLLYFLVPPKVNVKNTFRLIFLKEKFSSK